MLLGILITFIVANVHQGTYSFQECLEADFQPKACYNARQLYKGGKFMCNLQGKKYDGSSDCKVD